MRLNPLAAALQGIGFSTFLVAMQGLFGVTEIPEPLPIRGTSGHIDRKTHRRVLWGLPWEDVFIDPLAELLALGVL